MIRCGGIASDNDATLLTPPAGVQPFRLSPSRLYEPGTAFEEVKHEVMLDLSPTDLKEFWLIQWIKDKDFDVSNFHGQELSLKLHKDGNLGSLESSSGKSYDLVSFAYQQPNATVFLPSESETKAVGKISRRVCLFRHKKHEELGRPSFGSQQQPSLLVPRTRVPSKRKQVQLQQTAKVKSSQRRRSRINKKNCIILDDGPVSSNTRAAKKRKLASQSELAGGSNLQVQMSPSEVTAELLLMHSEAELEKARQQRSSTLSSPDVLDG